MRLQYYIEMQDAESGEIADIYGYENRVTVWAPGFYKEYKTESTVETKTQADEIETKLVGVGFATINKEDRSGLQ